MSWNIYLIGVSFVIILGSILEYIFNFRVYNKNYYAILVFALGWPICIIIMIFIFMVIIVNYIKTILLD